MPLKVDWVKQSGKSEEDPRLAQFEADLATLDLTRPVTQSAVRHSFQQMIKKYHPDRNQSNPEATEMTIDLIQAYERLSEEGVEHALDGLDDADSYYKIISEFTVDLLGLNTGLTVTMSMGGDGRDWIYASSVTEKAERIYLGTYEGNVYSVSKYGDVQKTFDTGETSIAVKESSEHLYIQSFDSLKIFQRDQLIRRLPLEFGSHVVLGQEGFLYLPW
jgi:hypothetical protein